MRPGTSNAQREERRGAFDRAAEKYDGARPGYPERLIEDVRALIDGKCGGSVTKHYEARLELRKKKE